MFVHCRTGSLEKCDDVVVVLVPVHCRTGSLETTARRHQLAVQVHCRTGSLETPHRRTGGYQGSLPHRQLRKASAST